MSVEIGPQRATPVGIILVCLFLMVYSLFWIVTWVLAQMGGNGLIALLSLVIAVAVLVLAYFLYHGNRTAWWVTLAALVVSTVWRLSLVMAGQSTNLLNAIVGSGLVLYLLSKHEFYQATS